MSAKIAFWFLSILVCIPSAKTNSGPASNGTPKHVRFVKEDLMCNVTYRISKGCSERVDNTATGLVECASLCGQRDSCIGASLDDNGVCFLHQLCFLIDKCTERDERHHFLSKFCLHGELDSSTGTCKCVNGTSGQRCNVYPRKCNDLPPELNTGGLRRIILDPYQDGSYLIHGHCYIKPNHALTILMNNPGQSLNFNRTWDEYVNGFHHDNDTIWGGLEAAYHLTKSGVNEVGFHISLATSPETTLYKYYQNFTMLRVDGQYKFQFDSSSFRRFGPDSSDAVIGDCLGPLEDTPFSTWDRDDDGDDTENCAAISGSGWWYQDRPGCNKTCNFMGLLSLSQANMDLPFPERQLFTVEGLDMDIWRAEITVIRIYFL